MTQPINLTLYFWPTPNGHKITICLEELKEFFNYKIVPINILQGDQFGEEFLAIAPNNKIPAISIDSDAGVKSLFESGAILQFLASTSGKLLGKAQSEYWQIQQWLFWQMGGLGPICGQNHHFCIYAPEKVPYAMDRFIKETSRLYKVMDNQLAHNEYLAGDFSIADIACYPWTVNHQGQSQELENFPHLKRWFTAMANRDSVKRAYEIGKKAVEGPTKITPDSHSVLFGQSDESSRGGKT